MATKEKRLLRKCKNCNEWLEHVREYDGNMLCPECAKKLGYDPLKVKPKGSNNEDK